MKLLIISLESNPFNNDLFNEFVEQGVDTHVLFLVKRAVVNNTEWDDDLFKKYSYEYPQNNLSLAVGLLKSVLFRKYSLWLITGWYRVGAIISLLICYMFKQKFCVWADTVPFTKPKNILISLFRSPIRNIALKKSCAILTTGQPGIDSIKNLGVHPERILNFPYTINQNRLIQEADNCTHLCSKLKNISQDKVIIFFAGQLIYRKGLDVLIRSLSILNNKNVYLIVEGVGPLLEEYKSMVSSYGLENVVNFVGFNQSKVHSSLLGLSDIVVVPSRWDPWGNLVHEAMSLGKTVVASKGVCAAKDRIRHDNNGYVFQSESVDELAEQLNVLLENKHEISRLGKNALLTANTWPVERNVATILNYLNGLRNG